MDPDEIFTADITEQLTIGSTSHRCVASKSTSVFRQYPEVVRDQIRLSARLAAADFTTLPTKGDKVTLRGTVYRVITRPQPDSQNCTFVIGLGDEFARL